MNDLKDQSVSEEIMYRNHENHSNRQQSVCL